MASETTLLGLASSIADGSPIDWQAAESSAQSVEELELIRSLRVISSLGGVHRTSSEELPHLPRPPVKGPEAGAVPHWGHFALLERLGHGSQGEVFRAVDTKLARDVALKFVRRAESQYAAETALLEARLLARVRHPNVVTVHGADLIDGRVGIWMDLIQGVTLAELVSRTGPMSAPESSLVGIDICRAVSAVHAAGLLHRDIKPQNVMRESGGRLLLMDFGAGHDPQNEATTHVRFGTPLYLAPEVLGGGPATVQSEIYAIGVLLFYLVTGQYPVAARTLPELRDAHELGTRRNLIELRGDLPARFVSVVDRATHPVPQARFRSVSEMADALTAVVTAAARTTDTPNGSDRPAESRPARGLMAGVGAALSLAIIFLLWHQLAPPPIARGSAVLAVLPFQDLSNDHQMAYLAEGLADQLITDLGRRTDLTVIARTSSSRFVGGRAMADLAREANVNVVIEGSLRRQGEDIVVSMRVIGADTSGVLSSFTRHLPLGALSEIAPLLLSHVTQTLRASERQEPGRAHPPPLNAAALDAYFRGWSEYWRLSRDGFKEARRLFQATIALEPTFAPAHSALAYVTYMLGVSYHELPMDEALTQAQSEVSQALALDPNNAHAVATSGWIKFYSDWDWEGAEQLFRIALELNPSDPQVRWMYAQLLLVQNRTDAGLQEALLAQRLDPLNPSRHSNVATAYYYGRRYEDAAREARTLLAQDPNAAVGHFGLSRFLSAMGEHEDAALVIRTALNANEPPIRAELARNLMAAGRDREARELLPAIEMDYRSGRLAPEYYAFVVLAQGDDEGALALLREGVKRHSSAVVWINVDPRYDALRQDERFVDLLRTMGLAS